MRTISSAILTVFFSFSAMAASASESYVCSTQLPQGTAEVTIENGLGVGQQIKLNFYNQARNQNYVGTLKVASSTENNGQTEILAQGVVLAYEAHPAISVSLQGSIDSASGDVTLQLYAGGDRRIELGYGNILRCQKQ